MPRPKESKHGTTHTPTGELSAGSPSDVKLLGYILHPEYQEIKGNRHRVRKRQLHMKSLEEERGRDSVMSLLDLPAEVIEIILSYLIAPLSCYNVDPRPRDGKELARLNRLSEVRAVLERHPFYLLAAACHTLRISVETFASHLLHQYEQLLCFELVEQAIDVEGWREEIRAIARLRRNFGMQKKQNDERTQVLPPYRLLWVRWSYWRCLFCGRTTKRHAIFNRVIYTCAKCDKREWPKLKRKEILSDRSNSLLPIHLESPQLAFPHHKPDIKPPLFAHDGNHGLFYLKSDITTLTSFVRDHDPDGTISWAAQRKKNGTLVLKQFNGKTVEIDTAMQGAFDVSSVLRPASIRPKARLNQELVPAELIPGWQDSIISQAISVARELQ